MCTHRNERLFVRRTVSNEYRFPLSLRVIHDGPRHGCIREGFRNRLDCRVWLTQKRARFTLAESHDPGPSRNRAKLARSQNHEYGVHTFANCARSKRERAILRENRLEVFFFFFLEYAEKRRKGGKKRYFSLLKITSESREVNIRRLCKRRSPEQFSASGERRGRRVYRRVFCLIRARVDEKCKTRRAIFRREIKKIHDN